ncbi:MAG: helix-turn-helix transcriptional regulator [Flavobacteriales bacterium]|nr:helix-turn-helix transcriptional regulator [Flavobacteriales bacterium]
MNQTIFLDENNNAIRFSEFNKLEAVTPFTGLGIKYVASGEETYYANDKKFSVKEGEYIIGNDFTSSIVKIDHSQTVQGLCIDISTEIISEVANYYDLNGTDLTEFLLSDQFFVNRYNIKNTTLGYSLVEINQSVKTRNYDNQFLKEELFYSLAESIITDQRFIFNHLNKMDFKKVNTNEEVFRILLKSKELLDLHAMKNLSLEEISQGAGISKYHFIRLFKNVFGISPYQYQIRRRLENAKLELLNGVSILDTAFAHGYGDLATFSKAFKQAFGQAPSQFIK